jgi:hypothetical protein
LLGVGEIITEEPDMVDAISTLTRGEIESFLAEFSTIMARETEDAAKVQKALGEHPCLHGQSGKNEWNNWELAFIDQIVLKNLSEHLQKYLAKTAVLNSKSPCDLIAAESSHAKEHHIACGTPAWSQGHPFNKAMGSSLDDLYKRWRGDDPKKRKSTFAAVCPDIALLAPFRVVFECKYFNQPANRPATSQLVRGLYQAFFYRAMPTKSPGTTGLKYGWDYEYACFLTYDATGNRRLRKAWCDLDEGTRKRFWDESNIYVILLPQGCDSTASTLEGAL